MNKTLRLTLLGSLAAVALMCGGCAVDAVGVGYDPGYGYPYPVDVPVYVPVIPDYGYLPPPNYGYYPPDYYNDPDDFDDWSPPYVSVNQHNRVEGQH